MLFFKHRAEIRYIYDIHIYIYIKETSDIYIYIYYILGLYIYISNNMINYGNDHDITCIGMM